jgi:hypothetical protein
MYVFKPNNQNKMDYIRDIFYMNKLNNSHEKRERLKIVFSENTINFYCMTPIYDKIKCLILLENNKENINYLKDELYFFDNNYYNSIINLNYIENCLNIKVGAFYFE